MDGRSQELLISAKEYFSLVIPVIPLKIFYDEKEGKWQKEPLVKWKQWETQPQTEDEFKSLPWDRANGFALICGVKTEKGYLSGVDLDAKNVTSEAFELGKKVALNLPITQMENTISGGIHYVYFSKQPVLMDKSYHNQAAVELLGEKTLMVMAPSEGYKRLNDNSPTQVEDLTAKFLEALTKAGVETEVKESLKIAETSKRKYIGEPYHGPDPYCISQILRGVEKGKRDECGIRLASYLINFRKLDLAKTIKLLHGWNEKNNPPLESNVIEDKIKSAVQHGYVYGCEDEYLNNFCCQSDLCHFWNLKATKRFRGQAIELLKKPDSILYVCEGLKEQGLVGEVFAGLDAFFTIKSKNIVFCDKDLEPVNQRYSGITSIGKTWIVVKASRLHPPEEIICRGGLSKKAVWHMKESIPLDSHTKLLDLHGKALIILEEAQSQDFLDEIKPILSHDAEKISYEYSERGMDQRLTSNVQIVYGWPAYIGLTTRREKREEQRSRALTTTPDFHRKKYRKVILENGRKQADPWEVKESVWTPIIQEACRQLKPVKFWVPWLDVFAYYFPAENAPSMRYWKFFKSFMLSIAYWYQNQLPKYKLGDEEYHLVPISFLEAAILIKETSLMHTLIGLESDVYAFYKYLLNEGGQWTYKDLQIQWKKAFGQHIPRMTLYDRYVNPLVDEGLLDKDDSKKPYKFSISGESLTSLTDINKALKKMFSEKTKAFLRSKLFTGKTSQYIEDPSSVLSYIYSSDFLVNVLEQLKSLKKTEWQINGFSGLSVNLVNDFGEKNPDLSNSICCYCHEAVEPMQPQSYVNGKLCHLKCLQQRKKSELDPKNVTRLARLYPSEDGKCARCKRKITLDFQVETEEGTFGFVCLDCAEKMRKANPGVEWLE